MIVKHTTFKGELFALIKKYVNKPRINEEDKAMIGGLLTFFDEVKKKKTK